MLVLGTAMQSNIYLQEVQALQSNPVGDWNMHPHLCNGEGQRYPTRCQEERTKSYGFSEKMPDAPTPVLCWLG